MRLHGSKGQVLMDSTVPVPATPVPVLVASLNAFTIDLKRDRVDVTSFGDLNKQYVQGLPDYQGTIGGFADPEVSPAGNIALFKVALGDVAAFLKLVPSTLAEDFNFSGLAYLDASLKVAADGAVTIEGSWAAAGPWVVAEPAALDALADDMVAVGTGARRGR